MAKIPLPSVPSQKEMEPLVKGVAEYFKSTHQYDRNNATELGIACDIVCAGGCAAICALLGGVASALGSAGGAALADNYLK